MTGRDRRSTRRHCPEGDDSASRVRLRAGRELAVVDASPGGVLVEGDVRVLPGTHVDVHVVTVEGRVLVRSRVVRAWVAALTPSRVTYRAAFAFERPVDLRDPKRTPSAA
jgi:hypothetical protein